MYNNVTVCEVPVVSGASARPEPVLYYTYRAATLLYSGRCAGTRTGIINRAIGSNPPISGYCTGTGNERLFFGRFSSGGLRGGGGFCFSQNGLVLVLILARRTCTALLNFSTVKKCEV